MRSSRDRRARGRAPSPARSQAQPAWDALGGAGARAQSSSAPPISSSANSRCLVGLCVREAGKTVADGVADVREAVDFLRYYAALARAEFAGPQPLPGPTGERNEISLHGRGVFACISPWNFPLAIFTGQVAAALAAGNAVIAKPAEQTPLTAFAAVRLLHEAGVPRRRAAVPAGRRARPSAARWCATRASPASRSPARRRSRS